MKKAATWMLIIALIILVIDWGVVGVNLLDGNYDVTAGAYVALVCFIVSLVCIVIRALGSKCPHCGRLPLTTGKFCPHCGKEI